MKLQNFFKDSAITLTGALTSLLTALILYWIESYLKISIYSLMICFVIPAGAGISGFVAASGYYFGSIFLNYKPNKTILISMFGISLGTYLFIRYLDYSSLEVQSDSLVQYWSFWEYLYFYMENISIKTRSGSVVGLQRLGYFYELLQVIGFSFGSFVLYLYLSSRLYCERCSLYFLSKGDVSRYTDNNEYLFNFTKTIADLLKNNNLFGVVSLYEADEMSVCDSDKYYLRTDLNLKYCKGCRKHYLSLSIFKKNRKNEWEEMHDLTLNAVSMKELCLKNPSSDSLLSRYFI